MENISKKASGSATTRDIRHTRYVRQEKGKSLAFRAAQRSALALVLVLLTGNAQAKDNDCERPFTLSEALAISESFSQPVNLPQCKSNLGGAVIDNTELAAAEIMGMLGIYTVACGRPPEVLGVTQLVSHIVTEATADGGSLTETSLREVVAVRVYECVSKDR